VRLRDAIGQITDWSRDGRYVMFEDFERRAGLSLIRSDGVRELTTRSLDLASPGLPDWIP
jgi:hypothetical protein